MTEASRVQELRFDQARRWGQGERVLVEAYLDDEPSLRADAEAVLELLYHEVVLREHAGDAPEADEYCRRFPDLATQIGVQFEVHRAIEQVSAAGPSTLQLTAPSAAPRPCAADLATAASVPGYELLGELGRGGMGVVYRARHLGLNRLVALKVLLAGAHAGARERAYFRAEARAVARLRHPNVVQVYDIGQHDALPYFSLELVEGPDLETRLGDERLPPREAAQVVEVLARAVQHAHEQGIIHRDLKPKNVLLAGAPATPVNECVPKITDFGLAKLLGSERPRGSTQSVLGTPHYMAPEQAAGLRDRIGPATDVHALGAILYRLLTGVPPFDADTVPDILIQVRTREPALPSRLESRVPRDLDTICLKCLHKDPARRYATAAALADDLRRFRSGEPIQARPVSLGERAWKWARRRPALAALAVVIVVAALTVPAIGSKQRALEQAATRQAHDRMHKFLRQCDEALFHGLYATSLPEGGLAASPEATRSAVRAALNTIGVDAEPAGALPQDPRLSDKENAELRAGVLQLLLLRAEAVARDADTKTGDGRRRDLQKALDSADRAAKLGPVGPAYHLRRGRYLAMLGDGAGATRERDEAARRQPKNIMDHFLLGAEHYKEGNLTQALADFQGALRLQPDDFWSRFYLIVVHLRMGSPAEAAAAAASCAELRPEVAWTHLLAALAHERQGDIAAAMADYQRALAQSPDPNALYALHATRGRMRFEHGDLAGAVADLERATALKPDQPYGHFILALVYQKQQRFDESTRRLDKALALSLGSSRAAECETERARNLYLTKRYADAVAACDAALKVLPSDAEAYQLKGSALLEMKREVEALRSFASYLENHGRPDADFYRRRGRARAQLRDYLGAVDDYTLAAQLRPDWEVFAYRGWAYYFADAWKPALRDFEEAIRRNPTAADAYIGRGLGRAALGDYRAAVADAQEALRLAPSSPEMVHNVACIWASALDQVGRDPNAREPRVLAEQYREGALQALRQALSMLPADERGPFWRDKMRSDAALASVRASPEFRHLDQEYGAATPR
jgi:tetratricopeptide (TPR) repeat protein